MEEVDGITDDILNDHAPGIAVNEFPGCLTSIDMASMTTKMGFRPLGEVRINL